MQTNQVIDFRSDTVTKPSHAMRDAMSHAEVGDDVYGEDPTVIELETLAASTLGTESALFVSSGTQGNLLALLSHCQRGDEYIVGHRMHSYRSEAGGAAVLGGIQSQALEAETGVPTVAAIEAAIKPDDFHYPRTRLVCLENTQTGRVLDPGYMRAVTEMAHGHGLSVHLDGARIFNAAVKTGRTASEVAAGADSISVCLSKGLGAPVGTVLCGTSAFVHEARRARKMLGGGMRQAGILAAAGIYALRHNVERLADDHANAHQLAEGLAACLDGSAIAQVDVERTETNMTFLDIAPAHREPLRSHLSQRGIVIAGSNPVRLVTHLDLNEEHIAQTIDAVAQYVSDAS